MQTPWLVMQTPLLLYKCRAFDCKRRWWFSEAVYKAHFGVGLIACPALGAAAGHALNPESTGPWTLGMILGFFAWLVTLLALRLAYKNRRQAVCVLIDEVAVTLRFPNPDALSSVLPAAFED